MTLLHCTVARARSATNTQCAAAAMIAAMIVTGCGSGSSRPASSHRTPTTTFTSRALISGVVIAHVTPGGRTPVNQPDDITKFGDHLFVAFQNGVGPQGEPTPVGNQGAGNRNSTIVELTMSGSPIAQWDVPGHVDGLTADEATGEVAVTANEDANARVYMITPGNPRPVAYHVPHLPHNGGLDAISFYHGMMLVSASAPGTTGKPAPRAAYPAVYAVSLNSQAHTASVRGPFGDEASANRANSGASGAHSLSLTDPDSNAIVPAYAPRFAGQFELTSQGDYLQIFTADPRGNRLSALKLSQSIDDSAWASGPTGTLYVTDGSADLLYRITGPFKQGMEIVGVTPCDAGNAPASCPGPGFPNNYLGEVDQSTGPVSKFPLWTPINPAGLLFVP